MNTYLVRPYGFLTDVGTPVGVGENASLGERVRALASAHAPT